MTYQEMKPIILNFLHVSRDAIHIHIGFGCLVLTLLFTKKKLNSFYSILPGFIVSVIMEILDLKDDYFGRGVLNFGAGLHDLVNTNFIPFILVLLAKRLKTKLVSSESSSQEQ